MSNTQRISRRAQFVKLYNSYGLLAILLLEILLFSLMTDTFFTSENIMNVGRQISFTGISGVGLAIVVLAGGIDISTGMMLALSGVLCVKLNVEMGIPLWLSIIITLLVALIGGILSGEVTARLRVPALITTLAFQTIYKGVAFTITNAIPTYGLSDQFKFLGQGYVFNAIPFPLIVMVAIFVIGHFLMSKTYIGRYVYAVGGNPEAARLAGINTKRVIILSFALCTFFTAIAGIMMAGRLGSGQPGTGIGFEMDVITSVTLGGISINGGKGSILYLAIGALIMGVLTNGMMLLGLNEYIQWIVKGLVLIFAVGMSSLEISKD